jgi:hypothetical protein
MQSALRYSGTPIPLARFTVFLAAAKIPFFCLKLADLSVNFPYTAALYKPLLPIQIN